MADVPIDGKLGSELGRISQKELDGHIEAHGVWLRSDGSDGQQLNMPETDLTYGGFLAADLRRANLSDACLFNANLRDCDLCDANVERTNLAWRPLVLVGDGAFQMTGLELSTAARYGLTPIVVVLDNQSYGTERPMLDGPFNDVHPWAVTEVTKLIGAGQAYSVNTEADFVAAIRAALSDTEQLAIIHVHLAVDDFSPALVRLTGALGDRV